MIANITKISQLLLILSLFFGANSLKATGKQALKGTVYDAENLETLPGASIYISTINKGKIADKKGEFSIELNIGKYDIAISFLGYKTYYATIEIDKKHKKEFFLLPKIAEIPGITIESRSYEELQREPVTGIQELSSTQLDQMPTLLGESDPMKSIQMLPGISTSSEGTTGFSVRGGNPDQNLILFDNTTIYDAGHLLGFFSVFNTDIIDKVEIYKGDIPGSKGGRLASIVEVNSRDGNMNEVKGTAGVGLISSKLSLDGPVIKDKLSFLVSARRSYLDLYLPMANDETLHDNTLNFYDLNIKLSYIASKRDRISAGLYKGRDNFANNFTAVDFGNRLIYGEWQRFFNDFTYSKATLSSSKYDYYIDSKDLGFSSLNWSSQINDITFKYDITFNTQNSGIINGGLNSTLRTIKPGIINANSETGSYNENRIPKSTTAEHSIFADHTIALSNKFTLRYGVRYSLFQNIGNATIFMFDDQFNITDTIDYDGNKIYNTYHAPEPRAGFSWMITPNITLKGSYTRTKQYIHLASNSVSSTPLDVWFSSSPAIKPQKGTALSKGLFYKSSNKKWNHSLEIFYRNTDNAIDFKDHPNLIFNKAIEGEVRQGKAKAKGVELMSSYEGERVNGWIAYTLSKSTRKNQWINDGLPYPSPFDRRHNLSLILNYNFSNRVTASSSFVYYTGTPTTWPVGRYRFQDHIIPYYSDRNAERMPDYHRLDLSLSIKQRERSFGKGEWSFSIYNLYGRKNPWMINFQKAENKNMITEAEMTYLFSVVPSISYTFRF
ncbi:TonB-dependent receptor [Marinilabiliaceae bacterium ANBcel2]|nr:TonB-dependent receptor [Marinilabiliaceae bacterium ANBcel2]